MTLTLINRSIVNRLELIELINKKDTDAMPKLLLKYIFQKSVKPSKYYKASEHCITRRISLLSAHNKTGIRQA